MNRSTARLGAILGLLFVTGGAQAFDDSALPQDRGAACSSLCRSWLGLGHDAAADTSAASPPIARSPEPPVASNSTPPAPKQIAPPASRRAAGSTAATRVPAAHAADRKATSMPTSRPPQPQIATSAQQPVRAAAQVRAAMDDPQAAAAPATPVRNDVPVPVARQTVDAGRPIASVEVSATPAPRDVPVAVMAADAVSVTGVVPVDPAPPVADRTSVAPNDRAAAMPAPDTVLSAQGSDDASGAVPGSTLSTAVGPATPLGVKVGFYAVLALLAGFLVRRSRPDRPLAAAEKVAPRMGPKSAGAVPARRPRAPELAGVIRGDLAFEGRC